MSRNLSTLFALLLPLSRLAGAAPSPPLGRDPGGAATTSLHEARAALEGGEPATARRLLEALLTAQPNSVPALQLLGVAEENLQNDYGALVAYGRALKLAPADEYSTDAVRSLCRQGLPRRVPAAQRDALFSVLGAAPLGFRQFEVKVGEVPGAPVSQPWQALHTTGVLFAPAEMMRDPKHADVALSSLPDRHKFNRLCYGYVLEPGESAWRLRFRVHYVSQYLAGKAYAPLAESLTGLLLRLFCLGKAQLGVETRFGKQGIIEVWLNRDGEAGGEHPTQFTGHLYFHGIDTPRPGLEWVREVAHEYGHHVIPPIDGYSEVVEPWATGVIGERLFLPWLRALGYGRQEDPGTFVVSPLDYQLYARREILNDANFFLDRGPLESLAADRTESGWRYLHGFLAYVAHQYGSAVLAETLKTSRRLAPGDFMTGIDLLRGFQTARHNATGVLRLGTELPIPSLSPRDEGAIADLGGGDYPELSQDGELAWWVYLPSAEWQLALVPEKPSRGIVSVGLGRTGALDRSVVLSDTEAVSQWQSLGVLATGWHVLRLHGANLPKPVAIQQLRLQLPPQVAPQ